MNSFTSTAPGFFGDLAVRKGWITYERLEEGLAELFAGTSRTAERLGEILEAKGYLTPEQVRVLLAELMPRGSEAPPSARLDRAGEHRAVDASIPPVLPSVPEPPAEAAGRARPENPILAEFRRKVGILLLVNVLPLAAGVYLWLRVRRGEIALRDPGSAFYWHLPQLAAACVLHVVLCWLVYPLSRRRAIAIRPGAVKLAAAACLLWAVYALARLAFAVL